MSGTNCMEKIPASPISPNKEHTFIPGHFRNRIHIHMLMARPWKLRKKLQYNIFSPAGNRERTICGLQTLNASAGHLPASPHREHVPEFHQVQIWRRVYKEA